jgi:bifunctional ADP-heptose synthase (sugar kinase/adenylyltransferase)/phosphoglycolate phosphatase-like HAD superfamily hydrolase
MDIKQITEILKKIRNVKAAVYGDFCLDAYWIMDPAGSEISVETGIKAESVSRQYYSPGGASNVVANLAALQPASIRVIGVTGNDIFGRELRLKFNQMFVDTRALLIQEEQFDTYTFVKKYYGDEEQPRIDFGLHNARSAGTDERILDEIGTALKTSDVLIINQQIPGSITRTGFLEGLNEIIECHNDKVILLDSRHYSREFRNVFLKTNYIDFGLGADRNEYIPIAGIQELAKGIYRERGKPVFITCGDRGMVTCDATGAYHVRGLQFLKKLDPVGAGDTALSAIALSLGAGYPPRIAAGFANLAAGVTVQKLLTTGTASPREILEMARDTDYLYNPDLAETDGKAGMIPGTRIEICEKQFFDYTHPVKHIVFDHDGTLSTLRKGWEKVMESFMIRVITGNQDTEAGSKKLSRISERVKEYIELSAGLRTILQMKVLRGMVEEFDMVKESLRKDEHEYKRLYLQELMKTVNHRLKMLETGKVDREKFIIPGAMEFLDRLKNLGMILYLVSGTDEPDVKNEARILGYDKFFGERIYGSREDMPSFSKKAVMADIVGNEGGKELMAVGDGPVEIRECRKRGGLSIGMATTEDGSGRIDAEKRRRLIRAGAHVILPDFSEGEYILNRLIH